MAATGSRETRLVGDIGGTNTRLALFDPEAGELQQARAYTNREFPSLQNVIARWLEESALPPPRLCCLAVAAPPFDDHVKMLNINWSFSRSEIGRRFQFSHTLCINDFEGNAYALPHLAEQDLQVLRSAAQPSTEKLAIVGPGTGLGGATLSYCNEIPVANPSEPGHMSLSPANKLEFEVFRALRPDGGEIWAEMVVSGPGLVKLYGALAKVRGEKSEMKSAADISASALAGTCSLCTTSLELFCALLGSISGDYVLATGSYGGVYLAGGILPRMADFLATSDFQHRFDRKGGMTKLLEQVPLQLITTDTTGLIGAAHAPMPAHAYAQKRSN